MQPRVEPPAPDSPSVCHNHGYVLAGAVLLGPEDPPLRDGDPLRPCGVLVCRSCGVPVRIWDNLRWKLEGATIRFLGGSAEELDLERRAADETPVAYEAADASRYLSPSPGARAYSCRCTRKTVLGEAWNLWHDDSGLPWACSGRHRA